MEEPSCLTFDCYGTLIDWDGGVQAAVEGTASLAGCDVGRLLEDREAADRALTAEGYQPYDEVLRTSLASAAVLQGRTAPAAAAAARCRHCRIGSVIADCGRVSDCAD